MFKRLSWRFHGSKASAAASGVSSAGSSASSPILKAPPSASRIWATLHRGMPVAPLDISPAPVTKDPCVLTLFGTTSMPEGDELSRELRMLGGHRIIMTQPSSSSAAAVGEAKDEEVVPTWYFSNHDVVISWLDRHRGALASSACLASPTPTTYHHEGGDGGQQEGVSSVVDVNTSLQQRYWADKVCYGCGPANKDGMHLRSFQLPWSGAHRATAAYRPRAYQTAMPGVLSGGVVASILDCHMNITAAVYLMHKRGLTALPAMTVTASLNVQYLKPTPIDQLCLLTAEVDEAESNVAKGKVTVRVSLVSAGATLPFIENLQVRGGGGPPQRSDFAATASGVFVALKQPGEGRVEKPTPP